MKWIYVILFLFVSTVYAAQPPQQPVSFPVTIQAGTWTSNSFNVPKNQSGLLKVEIPCDPTWLIEVYVQTSIDNEKTWSCDPAVDKRLCVQIVRMLPGPCTKPDGSMLPNIIGYVQKGTPLDNAKMRVTTISNQTKSVTIVITFDPVL